MAKKPMPMPMPMPKPKPKPKPKGNHNATKYPDADLGKFRDASTHKAQGETVSF